MGPIELAGVGINGVCGHDPVTDDIDDITTVGLATTRVDFTVSNSFGGGGAE